MYKGFFSIPVSINALSGGLNSFQEYGGCPHYSCTTKRNINLYFLVPIADTERPCQSKAVLNHGPSSDLTK